MLKRLKNFFSRLKESPVPLFEKAFAYAKRFFGLKGYDNVELFTGWVFKCVKQIAENVAMIDLRLYRKDHNGNKEQIFEHPAIEALNYVNEFFTKYTLFERLQADLELQGNEYWLLAKNKNQYAIYPLMPTRVTPIEDPKTYIKSYMYDLGGGQYLEIDPEFIIPFKNFNPKSDIIGKSTLDAVRLVAETDEATKIFSRSFFNNSARPDAILHFDGTLTQDQRDSIRSSWKDQFSGAKKAGSLVVLDGRFDFEKLDMTQVDMQFIEGRKLNRDEILAIFGVPKMIAGIVDDVNRASAEASMYAFMVFTILPKMRRIVDTLNEFYLPFFDNSEDLFFEVANHPPDDEASVVSSLSVGINSGIFSINDARRRLGLSEIEDGERVLLPFGLTPFNAPQKTIVKNPPQLKAVFSDIVGDITNKLSKAIDREQRIAIDKKIISEEVEKKAEIRWKQDMEETKPWEKRFTKASMDLFEDQKKRAIAELKTQKGTKLVGDILDRSKERRITIKVFFPIFQDLVKERGQVAIDYIGADEEFDVKKASKFIEKNSLRLAAEMTKTTSDQLRALVVAGVEQGESTDELARRISEYSGFNISRAEKIARTETIRGFAASDIEGWKQSEVVERIIWYTALDERVDDMCEFLHGKEVGLGKSFLDEDEQIEVGLEPYAGDIEYPPLHPNCRCSLIPVVENLKRFTDAQKVAAYLALNEK